MGCSHEEMKRGNGASRAMLTDFESFALNDHSLYYYLVLFSGGTSALSSPRPFVCSL